MDQESVMLVTKNASNQFNVQKDILNSFMPQQPIIKLGGRKSILLRV